MKRKKTGMLYLKIYFLSICFCFVPLIYGQNISKQFPAESLVERLKSLNFTFNCKITYDSKLLDGVEVPAYKANNSTVEEVLTRSLEKTSFTYKKVDKNLFAIILRDTSKPQSTSSAITLNGKVVNSEGEPIVGATVSVKNTTNGTYTDIDGHFTIKALKGQQLSVSFIGYVTENTIIDGKNDLFIQLNEDSKLLDEVVAIGYGTMKKKDLTGSVSSVSSEAIKEIPSATVGLALQGRTPGVVVQQTTGTPGGGVQIRIRGNNSIKGDNEPLWVVDGFPLSNANVLNITDIESIDVLKDASATAIYGARGANGVILVTTKKGKVGKTKIVYEGRLSIQNIIKKFDMLNASEYMQLMNIQQENDFGAKYFLDAEISSAGNGTDWQDLVYRSAPLHEHSVNISGGSDKTKFSIGLSYFDQSGILRSTEYDRLTLRLGIDHEISKLINLSANTILSRATTQTRTTVGGQRGNSILHAAIAAPSTVGPYNEDGSYHKLSEDYPFSATGFLNPVAYLNEKNRKWFRNRVLTNLSLTIKPIKEITILSAANVQNTEYRWDRYDTRKYPESTGSAGIEVDNTMEFSVNNTISYNKSIDKHNISAMVGTTYEELTDMPLSVTGDGYINDVLESYDIGSATTLGVPSSSYSKWQILSFLGRANYSYDDRYLATLSLRRDGSSRYSVGQKWGTFPSGALAWRVSNEKFMKNLAFVSNLKFRVGYGVTGNTSISPYQTVNYLVSETAVLNKQLYPGFNPKDNYPGDLKWESTSQTNIGIDLGLLNNKIQITADYYVKNTKDLLNDVQLPPSSGYTSTVQNIGKIKNQGVELQLDAYLIQTPNFKWDISANISFNKSEVKELSKHQDISGAWYSLSWMGDYINLIREGQPFGIFYGYKEDGYDANGNILYKNKDGESVLKANLKEDDKTYIGDPNPDYTYNFNSRLAYKDFSLSLFFQGVQGNDIYSLSMGTTNYDYGWGLNTFKEVLYNHWTPETPNAKYPKISNKNTYVVSDRFVYSGSYLRLKNIEIAYAVPVKKLGCAWISKAQVYVSSQNL
ncbi:MAG: SusC/RagA family TonB-linked outer membrane protein [Dysgonomonas sp.]